MGGLCFLIYLAIQQEEEDSEFAVLTTVTFNSHV